MTYTSKYSTFKNCHYNTAQYSNGNNALQIFDNEGLVATCSVNPRVEVPSDRIAVKDYAENEGMVNFLRKDGIIDKLVDTIQSGFVGIPVYTLTEKGLALFRK